MTVTTEVLFYHLNRQPLEAVLPVLVSKTLERGWRAVIEAGNEERVEALSRVLWCWRDDSFLAHGTALDRRGELQPVWITAGGDNPNQCNVRFFVDGATPGDVDGLERAVYLFNGHDEAAVSEARETWKRLSAGGGPATYWQQDETGRWQNTASN